MIYKIDLKTEKAINYTNVLIEAADKKEALSIFKKQRVHESGVSKKDYIARGFGDAIAKLTEDR